MTKVMSIKEKERFYCRVCGLEDTGMQHRNTDDCIEAQGKTIMELHFRLANVETRLGEIIHKLDLV
jgi:hypothetical protein